MLLGERVLIVEDEFLIALDIQRILETAHPRRTVFARNFAEVAALGAGLADFDLAIISPPGPDPAERSVVDRLAATGAAIVVCTASRARLAGTAIADAIIVDKPFADDHLLDACGQALARRRQP
ncbi:MAG TPA: hypothetical protein VHZ56_12765 [Devosia sp.]|nr:hypothetical protein [Devosia sp.]